jgi:hypothetical protein
MVKRQGRENKKLRPPTPSASRIKFRPAGTFKTYDVFRQTSPNWNNEPVLNGRTFKTGEIIIDRSTYHSVLAWRAQEYKA